jgi:hypothetical protein
MIEVNCEIGLIVELVKMNSRDTQDRMIGKGSQQDDRGLRYQRFKHRMQVV